MKSQKKAVSGTLRTKISKDLLLDGRLFYVIQLMLIVHARGLKSKYLYHVWFFRLFCRAFRQSNSRQFYVPHTTSSSSDGHWPSSTAFEFDLFVDLLWQSWGRSFRRDLNNLRTPHDPEQQVQVAKAVLGLSEEQIWGWWRGISFVGHFLPQTFAQLLKFILTCWHLKHERLQKGQSR